eukprot:15473964-Alexandrium_andersonii.AAC.1
MRHLSDWRGTAPPLNPKRRRSGPAEREHSLEGRPESRARQRPASSAQRSRPAATAHATWSFGTSSVAR